MEVGRPMEDEQAAQEHPATGAPDVAQETLAASEPDVSSETPGVALAPLAPAPAQEVPLTGEPRVDAALAGLGQLPLLPVGEHPAVFEQVHRGLRDVLGELDGSAGGPGPGR
jgi:hypothetical protein